MHLISSTNFSTYNASSSVRSNNKQRTYHTKLQSWYEASYSRSHSMNKTCYSISQKKNRTSYPRSHNNDKTSHTRAHNKGETLRHIWYKYYLISNFINSHEFFRIHHFITSFQFIISPIHL